MKVAPQNSNFYCFSQSIERLRCRGEKRCYCHLSIFVGSQRNREMLEKMELEPWMTSYPLKDTSPLSPHVCIEKAVAALCPMDARQKYQNISLLLSNTGPDLNAESHIKSQNLNPDLILNFTKVCRNQDLAVCDFKNISTWHVVLADLNWSCSQCWWLLNYICLWLMHQIHGKSTNVPHIKLTAFRQMPDKMNVWVDLIFITYIFNFVQRTFVCNVQQDELTLLTCTFMQYLL